jgi:hypothetical protein
MKLLEFNNDSMVAFPRYFDAIGCKANSASGGLNSGCISLYLTTALFIASGECPSDIIDVIGRWKTSRVVKDMRMGID